MNRVHCARGVCGSVSQKQHNSQFPQTSGIQVDLDDEAGKINERAGCKKTTGVNTEKTNGSAR